MQNSIFKGTGFLICIIAFIGCSKTGTLSTNPYTGTGSVSQSAGTTTNTNLFPKGMRVAALGTITSKDNKTWILPAEVNFTNAVFPTASDLHNSYNAGHSYANTAAATAALSANDIVTIDADGEIFTTYIFADNYFEMYINGIPVGKDPVPYTEFNSCIVQFKVKRPFTMAVKCVDWEENLGLGTEVQGSSSNHIGDGGFIAVIKNSTGNIIDFTDNSWKAQTYYISPISDLGCLTESNNARLSSNCSTEDGLSNSYGIHWEIPTNWFNKDFNDANWPAALIFTNAMVGVDYKSSYTNFTDVFDDGAKNASFIWSSNLLLDNLVLLRKKIQ